jgi:hypothetical protein
MWWLRRRRYNLRFALGQGNLGILCMAWHGVVRARCYWSFGSLKRRRGHIKTVKLGHLDLQLGSPAEI